MNKLLAIWMWKILPMRAQNEMRNISGNWRKADPLLVAVSLVEVCPAVMWKSEFRWGDFPSKMSKIQKNLHIYLGKVLNELLDVYNKIWEERDKFRGKLLNEQEPGLEDLRNFQVIQIAKVAKIKRKYALDGKPRAWLCNFCLCLRKIRRSEYSDIMSHKRLFKETKEYGSQISVKPKRI